MNLRCSILLLLFAPPVLTQAYAGKATATLPVGLRMSATEANSPPGSCGCFQLLGGGMDVALPLHRSLSVVVDVAGQHTASVPGTARGLSTITLLGGPRYQLVSVGRHAVFTQGLFGAVRGFDADFRRGSNAVDTATALAFAIGGGYELSLPKRITLRLAQVDYIQTNLPNGSNNRQQNVRFGAGVVFRLPVSGLGRR